MGSANRASAGYEFEVKTTINSQSTLYIEPMTATRATIQVARIGPHIITLRRDEGGDWVIHRRFYRPDLPVTMQAGLTVYTDWPTCVSAGYESNNQLVLTNGVQLLNGGGTLSGAQPDLVATFDFVRYARPQVPPALEGADLSNTSSVSDQQLLSFLGEHANTPGGAAQSPAFNGDAGLNLNRFQLTATVMSNRTYRLQSSSTPDGTWSDALIFVSTNTVQTIDEPAGPANVFYRLISP
jgi:hypothetical protein